MTPLQLVTRIRKSTSTTSASYKDEDIIIDINEAIRYMANRIYDVDENYYDIPGTYDLQQGIREYILPLDIMNSITKVEIVLNNQRILAKPLISEPQHVLTEEYISANYDDATPRYFFRRGCLFILSHTVPTDFPDGLIVTYSALPHKITDATADTYDLSRPVDEKEVGIPQVLHDLLGRLVVVRYKNDNNRALNALDEETYRDLDEALSRLYQKDKGLSFVVPLPVDDYGFNL